MSKYMYEYMHVSAHEGQKRTLDFLELELQEAINCLCGGWKQNSDPLQKGQTSLTTELPFQPLNWKSMSPVFILSAQL